MIRFKVLPLVVLFGVLIDHKVMAIVRSYYQQNHYYSNNWNSYSVPPNIPTAYDYYEPSPEDSSYNSYYSMGSAEPRYNSYYSSLPQSDLAYSSQFSSVPIESSYVTYSHPVHMDIPYISESPVTPISGTTYYNSYYTPPSEKTPRRTSTKTPGTTTTKMTTHKPSRKMHGCRCNSYRWTPIKNLSNVQMTKLFDTGMVDRRNRRIFPCRAFINETVRVGSFSKEEGACRVWHKGSTILVKDTAQVLSIPGCMTKICTDVYGHRYRSQYDLINSRNFEMKMRAGSATPIFAGDQNKFIAFGQIPNPNGKTSSMMIDVIGTARMDPNNHEMSAVFAGIGVRVEKRNFTILACASTKLYAVPRSSKLEKKISHPESASRKWPGGVVNYKLSNALTSENRRNLRAAFDEFESSTCIRFEPARSTSETNYVSIELTSSITCAESHVCMVEGYQSARFTHSCMNKTDFIHELAHTLCLSHEQWRGDRDSHVSFDTCSDAIRANVTEKLVQAANNSFHGIYDYASQMHYPCTCEGKGGVPKMANWTRCGEQIPGNEGLSMMDAENLNELYDCKGCHRHRWRSIDSLTHPDLQNLYNFGHFDERGRLLYPCRAIVAGEVAVGAFLKETSECVIPSRFGNKSVHFGDRAEVLTIPGGLSSCEGGGEFRYQLQSVMSFGSSEQIRKVAVPAANGWNLDETEFAKGFIAYSSFSRKEFEVDSQFIRTDNVSVFHQIGTAWHWLTEGDMQATFATSKGNLLKSNRFKILTCTERRRSARVQKEREQIDRTGVTCDPDCDLDSTGKCVCSTSDDY